MAAIVPSIEYFTTTLRVCWPLEKLKAAAETWPPSTSWTWWCGDRLAGMTDREALLRVQVALTHCAAQRLELPGMRYGEANAAFKTFAGAQLQTAAAALGAWLDTPTADAAASFAAAMRGELAAVQAAVIEAAPPDVTTTAKRKITK